jgi:hypothetical protein
MKYGAICDQLYIDSTGKMVKDVKKQVLLHITSEMDVFLKAYTRVVRKVKAEWTPYVSDFSLAYLNGASAAFCDMNLYSYT